MPRFVLSFALWLCCVSLAVADQHVSFQQDGTRRAAACVKNWCDGYNVGMRYSGTGTLVATDQDRGLVLTAGHLFKDKVGPITVEFPDGQVSGARLLAVDHKLDVAALWIFAPKDIEPVPLGELDPKLGEQVEIWGYGPKRFRSFLANVSRPIPVAGDQPGSLVGAQGLDDHMVTIPGDSGGPMVSHGKLVGVHWGYRGADTDPRRCVHAVGCNRLRSWLKTSLKPTIYAHCLEAAESSG